jgi:protein-S-isoprenylcysteine O-methyltransferase Ste14
MVATVCAAVWRLPPRWPDAVERPLDVLGVVLAIMGAVLVAASGRALGAAMTPLPEPKTGGQLVARGPYRLARHPMYGGVLLIFVGVSVARSALALVLTAGLALLLWRKSLVEERRLAERYADYEAYRSRTPHRFFPFIS